MNNWRTVSPYMTEDEAWNELADLEIAGFHYNLEEKMPHQIILTRKEVREAREEFEKEAYPCWHFPLFDAFYCDNQAMQERFAACRLCKRLTEFARGEEEDEMSKCVICEKCGGLKHIETEPCEYDSTSGSSWSGFCSCPNEEIERDIEEAVEAVRAERFPYDYPKKKDIMQEISEYMLAGEYANYAKQEIRFCPYCGAALGIV